MKLVGAKRRAVAYEGNFWRQTSEETEKSLQNPFFLGIQRRITRTELTPHPLRRRRHRAFDGRGGARPRRARRPRSPTK